MFLNMIVYHAKNYQSYKMREVKQIHIKNGTYNDMINIKNFEPNLLIDGYETIYSVNPLYLWLNHASEYIEEKNENKYLNFDSTDENKELQKISRCLEWN